MFKFCSVPSCCDDEENDDEGRSRSIFVKPVFERISDSKKSKALLSHTIDRILPHKPREALFSNGNIIVSCIPPPFAYRP